MPNNFYTENPLKNLTRSFKCDDKEYTTNNSTILSCCGKDAYKLVNCKKVRYGYEVVYQLRKGTYDSRDSSEVSGYVSFYSLIKNNPKI